MAFQSTNNFLLIGFANGNSATPTIRVLDAGTNFNVTVITFTDVVKKCYLETPENLIIHFKPNDESNEKFQLLPDRDFISCSAVINNVDINDNGLWILRSEAIDGSTRSQSYQLTVNPREDSTEADTETIIEYLDDESFNTSIGSNFTVTIPDYLFVTSEICRLLLPSGRTVNLENLNLENVEVISNANKGCSVRISVTSEDDVGRWALISVGTRYTEEIERRLRFEIAVEEIVDPSVSEVNVVEGNDFSVRLRDSIPNADTCRLMGPKGTPFESFENDKRYKNKCGYIIRNVRAADSGNWSIIYGNRIIYRAPILVTVHGAVSIGASNFTWTIDRPVNETFGPENTIYCKVEGPRSIIYFDGFGKCRITLDKVTSAAHKGVWKMFVGLPGHVLTQNSEFFVRVEEAAPKPTVTTSVVANKPLVFLSCSVTSTHPINSCKLRDPSGRILITTEGVGENRYSWHGTGSRYVSGAYENNCGLQITDPLTRDLGLWRCAMETEDETYYGFLRVLCPWAMRDPEVAASVVSVPTLTAVRNWVTYTIEESVTMSCSIQAPIRYCYFRARNGTVFNVGPGISQDLATYVGAGFDAGECGVRFSNLAASDSGAWSCHVGLLNATTPEQRARIDVTILDTMVATQRMERNVQVLDAQVYNRRAIEYCRFVRIDGFGFTDANIPSNYISNVNLAHGRCCLTIERPTIMEQHPWTIVAKILGQNIEISRTTSHTLEVPELNPPAPPGGGVTVQYRIPLAWIVVMSIGITMIVLAVFIGPKRNREWTRRRASAIRSSFTKKAAAPTANQKDNNTAIAA